MDNWITHLAEKAMRIYRINRFAAGNHRQDLSLPILERLQNEGYGQVTWNSGHSTHSECRDLNRQTWALDDFLRTTEYDAPLFSRSHPGDNSCTLIVGGDGLPSVQVDSYGDTDEAIRISRPVSTPKEQVKPEVKVVVPKPEQKIIETPVPPKEKIVYVPKEVHKQIKDPFEKEKLSPEDYEEWLKDLEKEDIEEVPFQPTDEDKEEWLKGLESETSLKSIKPWITGLFRGY